MRPLKTPDVTKAQMIALATGIAGTLAAMGLPLSEANENRLFTASIALGVGLKISDAIIRFGRAMMVGKRYDLGLDFPEGSENEGYPED